MFRVMIGLREIGDFNLFVPAFQAFYKGVMEMVEGGASLNAVESTNFITMLYSHTHQPMNFYQVVGFAHEVGLLTEGGQPVDSPEEPPHHIIQAAFIRAIDEHAQVHGDDLIYTVTTMMATQERRR